MERDESRAEPTTPGPVAQKFIAPSLQGFLALLKEFWRVDSAPTQPESFDPGDETGAES
jgi:hypothetical protein